MEKVLMKSMKAQSPGDRKLPPPPEPKKDAWLETYESMSQLIEASREFAESMEEVSKNLQELKQVMQEIEEMRK